MALPSRVRPGTSFHVQNAAFVKNYLVLVAPVALLQQEDQMLREDQNRRYEQALAADRAVVRVCVCVACVCGAACCYMCNGS